MLSDSRERVGITIKPVLLKTRSLAAELAGAHNNWRATGLKPLNL